MNVLAGGQLVGFFLFLGTSVGAQGVRLNGALDATAIVGDVEAFTISPDGQWAAYLADQEVDGQRNLYTARADGTGPVHRINGPLVVGGQIQHFVFTPDSARVIYLADEQLDEVWEIFSAPSNGSTPTVKLNGPLVPGGDVYRDSFVVPWAFTSDGQWMVYLADEDVNDVQQLFAVSTDGSAPSIPLLGPNLSAFGPQIAADDATVVFAGASTTDSTAKLFKVPLDGSAAAVRINGTITAGTSINRFRIAPDASRVVYMADRSTSGKIELFSRPLDLSAPAIVLNDALASNRGVFHFLIASTSQDVVYEANRDLVSQREIYSVPLDGSAPPVELNHATSGTLALRSLAPDGGRVLYAITSSGGPGLYSVPIDGSALPVQLSTVSSGEFSPDGARVLLFSGDYLASVPADGSGPAVQLSPPLPVSEDLGSYLVSPDSTQVLFTTKLSGSRRLGLYLSPIDGSTAAVPLTEPSWGSPESSLFVDPLFESVFYLDETSLGATELVALPLDGLGPRRTLNDSLPGVLIEGEVATFAVSPDGRWVVYADSTGYHSRPLAPLGPPRRLTPAGLTSANGVAVTWGPEVGFAPDMSQVLLSVSTFQETLLYRAPLDGSQPATLIEHRGVGSVTSTPVNRFHAFRFTPDGATVLYQYFAFNYFGPPNSGSLHSAPLDGSQAPTTLQAGTSSIGYLLSLDGSRLVVHDEGFPPFTLGTLTSRPLDGSTPAVSLLPSGFGYFGGLGTTPDGTRVIYRANLPTYGSPGLYSAPIDASQPPTLLASVDASPVLANPTTPHVAFWTTNGAARELRYVPADGSAASILLASLPTSVSLNSLAFLFSPDGTRLVYRANATSSTVYELYSVPVDASQPPVKVNGPLVAGGNVTGPTFATDRPHFAVTPDGQRVVYAADARVNDIFELWSAPLTGGGPAQILNNPLPAGLQIFPDFHILSNSTDILYRGNPAAGFLPLWQARTDRLGPFKLRSGPFPLPSVVEPGFVVTRGERHVVYRADHGTPGRTELWFAPLQRTRATR